MMSKKNVNQSLKGKQQLVGMLGRLSLLGLIGTFAIPAGAIDPDRSRPAPITDAVASEKAQALPEVKATEDILPIIIKAIKSRPSFRVKLKFDSEAKNLGPLKEGKAQVMIPFQSDLTFPMDPKKPEAGEVIFMSAGIFMKADLALTPAGNFDGKVWFEKLGAKTDLESTIQYSSLPGVQFRFSEIEFLGQGVASATPVLKITGNCVLKQLVLEAMVKSAELITEKWIDAKCVYEFVYDKSAGRYRFKFDYDSLTEEK